MGEVIELIKREMGNDIRGALVRLSNNFLLNRPVTKLYPIEYVHSNKQEAVDIENLTQSRREVRGVTANISRINSGKNIGLPYLVRSVRTCCTKTAVLRH